MIRKRLNLGILLDSYRVPAWAYNAVERVAKSDCAYFSVVVFKDREKGSLAFWRRISNHRHNIVYYIFNRIDELLNRIEPNAFASRDLGPMLSHVRLINAGTFQKDGLEYFNPLDIQKIVQEKLDVLIKIGFGDLGGEILRAARFGVWDYHHGDYEKNRVGPPGFWEVVEAWPETGSTLRILGRDGSADHAIYRSWSLTHPYSPARNRNYYFWESALFLSRQIELLFRSGKEGFIQSVKKWNEGGQSSFGYKYKVPGNLLALKLYFRLFIKFARRLIHKLFFRDQWYLMFQRNGKITASIAGFRALVPPKDRFWADPHVIKENGHYYVFVEEYIYRNHRGHISVLEFDGDKICGEPVRILDKNHHLSYPSVFKCGENYYMVPESAECKSIDLYECIKFPYEWKFKKNILNNVTAVDTTLFHYADKWWLFTGLAENEGSLPQVELNLFYSRDLFSDAWTPHPLNPLISDVKRARPAGKIFIEEGIIYRPSQDCSRNYGYGYDLNEIILLSESEYIERKAFSVRAEPGLKIIGVHTFSREENLTIIDAVARRSKYFCRER